MTQSKGQAESDDAYDVIVVGLGVMGAMTAWRLTHPSGPEGAAAAAGVPNRLPRVLGIEQFSLPHSLGSSHGRSRIFRAAYFEGAAYVPLALRAKDLWQQLEQDSVAEGVPPCSTPVLLTTGSLELSPEPSRAGRPSVVRRSRQACEAHGLPFEWYASSADIRVRFRAFRDVPDGYEALFQPDGGVLDAQMAQDHALALARARGLAVLENTRVEGIDMPEGDSDALVTVRTSAGQYRARHVVVSAGPWTNTLLSREVFPVPIEPERQVLGWYDAAPSEDTAPARAECAERPTERAVADVNGTDGEASASATEAWSCSWNGPEVTVPAFLYQTEDPEEREWYGMPSPFDDLGGPRVVKFARFGHYQQPAPLQGRDEPVKEDQALLDDFAARVLPQAAGGGCRGMATCIFSNSPDHHFVVDTVHSRVQVAAGFSGHGFKFGAVIGELLARQACFCLRDEYDGALRSDDASRKSGLQEASEPEYVARAKELFALKRFQS